jgi:hypothetical protein
VFNGLPSPAGRCFLGARMNLGTALLVILILLLVGVFPGWGHHNLGYMPGGVIGVLLIIVVVLVLTKRL